MAFTTVSGHTDYPTVKPAIDTTVANDERFVTDAVGMALPSEDRAEVMNDIVSNIRAAATAAGVNLTSLTRGDTTALTKIIQGLAGSGVIQQLQVSANYNYSAFRGSHPLQRVRTSAGQRWNPSFDADDLVNGDIAIDVGNTNRTSGTNVSGEYVGEFTTALYTVNSAGLSNTHANLTASDIGKAVYLVTSTVTSNGIRYSYALWESLAFEKQFEARYIGRITAVNTTTGIVTVAFNLLSDPEKRVRRKLIWDGGNTGQESGVHTLVSGERFSKYSTIEFAFSDSIPPREYAFVSVPYHYWNSPGQSGGSGVTANVNQAWMAVYQQSDTQWAVRFNRHFAGGTQPQTGNAALTRIYGVL